MTSKMFVRHVSILRKTYHDVNWLFGIRKEQKRKSLVSPSISTNFSRNPFLVCCQLSSLLPLHSITLHCIAIKNSTCCCLSGNRPLWPCPCMVPAFLCAAITLHFIDIKFHLEFYILLPARQQAIVAMPRCVAIFPLCRLSIQLLSIVQTSSFT